MSLILKLAFLFCIGCSAGWGLELIFRRFFSKNNPERKWINPGFLTGPWLPLYGFGLCMLYLLAGLERYFTIHGWFAKIVLFLIMAICMTAIEYVAGIVSIKILKVHLWDYSAEWGNINGIICPRFSLFWAILGAVYYFLIHPNILFLLDWLAANLTFSFVIGFYLGIFSIDVVCSCNVLAKIRSFAEDNKIVVKYDRLQQVIASTMELRKQRRRFFFSLYNDRLISEHLREYLSWLKTNVNVAKEVLEQNKRPQ
ncbi:MAG: putative ABC transporter permease [Clostridia bacterium]|nr:putative ABC transporter permease [Clostridia bacterium]